jgi:hypothetical protein
MAIASKVLNVLGPRTRESSRTQGDNRLLPADRCRGASPHYEREEISAELAWCGPGALAALLAFLETALKLDNLC